MEAYPDYQEFGHFEYHINDSNASDPNGLFEDSYVDETYSFEGSRNGTGVGSNYSQSAPAYGSANGSAHLSLTMGSTPSQSSPYTAFSLAWRTESNSTGMSQATEIQNWKSNSDVFRTDSDFRQWSNTSVEIAGTPSAPVFIPLYQTQPPQATHSSSVSFQPLRHAQAKAPIFTMSQGFEPSGASLDGESQEGSSYSTSLYDLTTFILRNLPNSS